MVLMQMLVALKPAKSLFTGLVLNTILKLSACVEYQGRGGGGARKGEGKTNSCEAKQCACRLIMSPYYIDPGSSPVIHCYECHRKKMIWVESIL